MIIEHFKEGAVKQVYQRFDEKGRMMPEEVSYINSWVDQDFKRCYQVMESPDRELLDEWIANWKDLVDFEVIPVMTSAEARQKLRS
jgi:hypothetical protein